MTVTIIAASISLLVGIVIGLFFAKKRKASQEARLMELEALAKADFQTKEDLKARLASSDEKREAIQKELQRSEESRAIAETKLEELQKNSQEKIQFLEKAEEKLITAFQAVSGESLKSNNQAFIEQAKETLETVLARAKGQFGEKEESIKNIVGSLDDALKKYEKQIHEFENKRANEYGSLDTQIKSLLDMNQQLQKETGNLVNALKKPDVRGRWGEVTLRRVVELAGLSEHCDFKEQVSVTTSEGRIRPDMIVHLPSERQIVVDSKVSLDAYLNAISAATEEEKKKFLVQHSKQLRQHMKDLYSKGYWDQFDQAPEFVVMFIPGESFLSAAVENDPNLIEDGMDKKVIVATPTTLIALLRAIAYGWKQEQVAQNAQEIAKIGKEIYERFQPFLGHVNKTGEHLAKANDSYNSMISSLERRVMVSVKKFKELGATNDKDLPETSLIDTHPVKTKITEDV